MSDKSSTATPMAILISARRSMVDVDDAIRHLADHRELYWSLPVKINTSALSFPIFGFIHVTGEQVEYRTTITDIIPFDAAHYDNTQVKPEPWRNEWKQNIEGRKNFKIELVMTRIDPFSCETTSLRKHDGEPVTIAPRAICKNFDT
jgi:hypothetical protein